MNVEVFVVRAVQPSRQQNAYVTCKYFLVQYLSFEWVGWTEQGIDGCWYEITSFRTYSV